MRKCLLMGFAVFVFFKPGTLILLILVIVLVMVHVALLT